MEKTWKPTAAGILNIITGALSVLSAIGLIFAIIAIGNINIMRLNLKTNYAPGSN